MVRVIIIGVLLCAAWAGAHEKDVFVNYQFHRDFHRETFTSTIEIFQTDRLGSSFFFTDFDFDSAGEVGSYFELARSMTYYRHRLFALNASLQYNDGVLPFDGLDGKGIPRTWLAGVTCSDVKPLDRMWLEFQVLARQELGADLGWQLTGVWSYAPLKNRPLMFAGFADWNSNETNDQPTSFQAEPQVWYPFWRTWSVGGELEISRNFVGAFTKQQGFEYRHWYTHPTLMLRVDF